VLDTFPGILESSQSQGHLLGGADIGSVKIEAKGMSNHVTESVRKAVRGIKTSGIWV
jgi:hypothetical protein